MKLSDEVHLNIAKEVARLSKDKNTKVGCVIVDKEGRIVSTGRNGPVAGLNDNRLPHSREEETFCFYEDKVKKSVKSNKYPYYLHSESNAVLFVDDKKRLIGSTIFITGFPCSACALIIAQSKIKRVVVAEENNIQMVDEAMKDKVKYLFSLSGIELVINDKRIDFYSCDTV